MQDAKRCRAGGEVLRLQQERGNTKVLKKKKKEKELLS